jgi:membrane-associated phospholipid phosphatase
LRAISVVAALTIVSSASLAARQSKDTSSASDDDIAPVSDELGPVQGSQESTAASTDGQSPTPAPEARTFVSTLFHNLADDVKHLPRQNSGYWLAGGGVLALAVHPEDTTVNRHLLGSSAWDHLFAPGHIVGSTEVQIAAAVATYAIGRYRSANKARHIGMDLVEADILTEGIVEVLKYSVGRHRPLNPDGTPNAVTTPSFPSGHAAITFAGATVVQQHFGWKAAVPIYVVASYVALSRLHDNVHYPSDVVFGATTGIIVGRTVTWHGRNNFPVHLAVGPEFSGAIVEWR